MTILPGTDLNFKPEPDGSPCLLMDEHGVCQGLIDRDSHLERSQWCNVAARVGIGQSMRLCRSRPCQHGGSTMGSSWTVCVVAAVAWWIAACGSARHSAV